MGFGGLISKVKSAGFLFALTMLYFIFPIFGIYFFLFGSNLSKLFLLAILVYQYFICKESKIFRKFVFWGSPINFFEDHNLIFADSQDFEHFQKTGIPKSKTLLCYHPHGVMAYGVTILTYQYKFFESFVRLGSRFAINIPWGGLLLKLGGIQGINPQNLVELMKNEQNILMVPGGFEEATLSNFKEDRVFVKTRKGFIKYALKYGYTVHPCYGFNENKAYFYLTWEKLGLILNKFKIPAVIFISKFLGILPNNNFPLVFVVGKGIAFPKIDHPSKEEVEKFHTIYINSLKELFDKYKGKFGNNSDLKIL